MIPDGSSPEKLLKGQHKRLHLKLELQGYMYEHKDIKQVFLPESPQHNIFEMQFILSIAKDPLLA